MHPSTIPASSAPPFAALQAEILRDPTPLRAAVTAAYRRDEVDAVQWLLGQLQQEGAGANQEAQMLAHKLVAAVREKRTRSSGVDALMHEFSLSSEEGVALMCLAEALLRIPDSATADRLIADKISKGDWRKHLGESPSLFVNAATWGLLITGKLVSTSSENRLSSALSKLITKGGEPLIRKGVDMAMRMLGNQFVTGQTIEEAIKNSRDNESRGYRYSYDMLGEAALTEADAANYYASYESAIHAIGRASNGRGIKQGPGISVKLSALHARYSRAQRARVLEELLPRVKTLVLLAKKYNIGLNIDAEEADRLELSLDLMEAMAFDPELAGFEGIGFVVQAYQKRCPFAIDFLIDLAKRSGRKFMVRLVKGAYWDAEIKRAQVDGMIDYPVYTRKVYTDVSYLVCAKKLLGANGLLYPQFATHNAQTLAVIYTWAQQDGVTDYEFQCLHGMGETLYDQVVGAANLDKPCRIYAPVGSHETLLAYLVRRLLENGANSSFVNQIVDEKIAIESLITDPFAAARAQGGVPHPGIVLPTDMFGGERKNSAGLDLANEDVLREVSAALAAPRNWNAAPLIDAPLSIGTDVAAQSLRNPARHDDVVGSVVEANAADVDAALASASAFAMDWQTTEPALRAAALNRAADLFETHRLELMALAIREAGKSLPNAIAEVREAVDFLRYYAAQVHDVPNTLALGPVTCISPWNFPLAIFTGQIGAALAAGNVVLAKPAEQTPLIAHRAVELLHQAGVPRGALQFLPGRGEVVGAGLCADARVKGVIFTGSTEVAQLINRTLAKRSVAENCDIPLIAETGGQNALIVDSSALPEQVVQDAISSAFDSAGQRCSALRVLFLQEEIADKTVKMLKGAMRELRVGNPDRLATDIGPVIDTEAQRNLLAHINKIKATAIDHFSLDLPAVNGTFVAPTVLEIKSLSELTHEVFGPVLHVIRYKRAAMPQLIEEINNSGFGLTLGIHSRIDETIDFISSRAHVGNIYVNRNIVGAVVGVQPFGGEGKSGTGPKAGGPLYLKRLQRGTPAPAQHQRQATPALDALTVWATSHGHQQVADLANEYARTTLHGSTTVLPGPTGERNTLSFVERGQVVCMAETLGVLLNQLAAALATGNKALILSSSPSLVPVDLPAAVKDRIQWVGSIATCGDHFQIVMVEPALANEVKPMLAGRSGALVGTIETTQEGAIPLWRLVAERALCVNTTAAGGNASLMTLGA
ncbi:MULTISPECIES: trifunctional transcriptional regulator/proline dehydrogenase/L-glutamate gamma-semialdehyde dehydrogenase [unclassified Janthinobacterium]|uniref:trifunctional transcriptional regulator/proline dehydrogenase/L-glutamate gamma-semialdehyde dehydrogenase n=1 Tax=unclassified Janthinobacterium TaxID=2610881 RepID=UPI00037D8D19|nr:MULTISPECIES: trifunctional transcriptional regulator/proline dehydrogenase/L-glutamate gamma-semialdehyde dehydrogenase [unclassified Janthinobacterium]MEC5160035.1 RHH-type proline utilization regulon transcriptional repressor/proline dehydrogenase/delta 1-pyrroline-5-carboxylate dehydrogenase [Janthinobacterium sp. CG_S6]